MKKYVNPLPTGGVPVFSENINDALQKEIWDAIEAIATNIGSVGAAIITGCTFASLGAGNYSMSAGILVIDGVVMRIAAVASTTLPRYICANTPVVVTALFEDGGTKNLTTETTAQLAVAAPGSGSYITVNSGNFTALPTALNLKADKALGAWTAITLINGWSSAGTPTISYRVDQHGRVWLRGTIDSTGSSNSIFAAAGAVPTPLSSVNSYMPVTQDSAAAATISVRPDGTLQIVFGYVTSHTYCLDGISYTTN